MLTIKKYLLCITVCVGFWLLGYLRSTILILSTQLVLMLIEVKLVIIIINNGI